MVTDIHILLTYQCTFACDHCFLYSCPAAKGTMTLQQVRLVLDEAKKLGSVEWIYYEGGEPFLFYPLLVEGVALAKSMGFLVGIVTNGYWAISSKDARIWLKPLHEHGLDYLSVSDDSFHYEKRKGSPAKHALKAAKKVGIDTSPLSIQSPAVKVVGPGQGTHTRVIGGGVRFRGRAADTLTSGLPKQPWQQLNVCQYEDLRTPSRLHVDAYGHVHLCQGISMGNMWQTPLSKLVREYKAESHPVCGPLLDGGPAELAGKYAVSHEQRYVDECHFCFCLRRELIKKFPHHLAPGQVYGIKEKN
ncbi:MAG: radical SAM protein [Desulforhopalus sp.]